MAKQEVLLSPTTFLDKSGPIKRWGFPLGLFVNVLKSLPKISNNDVKAETAWEIDRYWLQRRSPNALKTLTGLSKALKGASSVYPGLLTQGEVKLGKQQPSFLEAVTETISRLKFLSQFTVQLPHTVLSCISGGSMSYGRHYNVRGGLDSSDLDLILVYENGVEDNLRSNDILPNELGFDDKDRELLAARISRYAELVRGGKAQVLSQKSYSKTAGFDVSMHLMSRQVFYESVIYGVVADLRSGNDVDRRLLDYKPQPFKHRLMKQRDFNGDIHEFSADESTLNDGVTDNEVISRIPAYAIREGKFIPGMYHNLISPRFEFEPFSSPAVSCAVTLYWSLMHDLQADYRQHNPSASVIKSHIRYDILSPKLKAKYE